MKAFSINRVFIKNFKSIKEQCVDFTHSIGLKLFNGQNHVEPRLGANGAGKSGFWNALFWCFYGTGVKGERTSILLSWDEKLIEVMTEVSKNDVIHTIYRSGPPMKIELDGKECTQKELDEFLGLTKERFLHSVLFGQGVDLLPDLSIPERGQLLDDVLQLDIWQKATERASKKCSALEHEISDKEKHLSYIEGQLSQLQSDKHIEDQIEYWKREHLEELQTIQNKITKWESDHSSVLSELETQMNQWKDQKIQELDDKIREIQNHEAELELTKGLIQTLPKHNTKKIDEQLKKVEETVAKLQKKATEINTKLSFVTKPRDFWMKNNICPTCLNPITDSIKQQHLVAIDTEEQELSATLNLISIELETNKVELQKARQAREFVLSTISMSQGEERKLNQDIRRLQDLISATTSVAEKLGNELEKNQNPFAKQYEHIAKQTNPFIEQLASLKKKKNPYTHLLDENKKKRKTLEKEKETFSTEIKQVKQFLITAEYWKHGFKRIRLYFINQILSALEIEIQSAMSSLGLDNWSVKLCTESMTKSETVKLGVQIKIKSPVAEAEWSCWSGGESQRLRLGIAMGFGSLIQRAAGCFWDMEAWDEPGQHLSEQGMEDLLESLKYRADSLNKSIFITHHSALIYSGFTEVWTATKDAEGTSITITGD